jgi:hypothetical protein
MNDNFEKYLKVCNLPVVINRGFSRIDFLEKYKEYTNLDACVRDFNIDSILDEQKEFYLLSVYCLMTKPWVIQSGMTNNSYKILDKDLSKIKEINEKSNSKIIIVGNTTIMIIYQSSDFIIEYIDCKPKIIKNRYYPIYD